MGRRKHYRPRMGRVKEDKMLPELIEKLNTAMTAIQSLQIQPTEHNCTRICTALGAIREAARIGAEIEKAGKPKDAAEDAAADPPEITLE